MKKFPSCCVYHKSAIKIYRNSSKYNYKCRDLFLTYPKKKSFLNSNFLESPSSSERSSLNDIHIVNLSLVSNVQVTREVSPTTSEPPQSLNLQRLNTRVRNQIDEKRRLVMALQAGVSPEGQKLFIAISKTIQDITWNGANIVVFNNVTIKPPYKVDNVHGNTESGAYRHVKKVVRINAGNV